MSKLEQFEVNFVRNYFFLNILRKTENWASTVLAKEFGREIKIRSGNVNEFFLSLSKPIQTRIESLVFIVSCINS